MNGLAWALIGAAAAWSFVVFAIASQPGERDSFAMLPAGFVLLGLIYGFCWSLGIV